MCLSFSLCLGVPYFFLGTIHDPCHNVPTIYVNPPLSFVGLCSNLKDTFDDSRYLQPTVDILLSIYLCLFWSLKRKGICVDELGEV